MVPTNPKHIRRFLTYDPARLCRPPIRLLFLNTAGTFVALVAVLFAVRGSDGPGPLPGVVLLAVQLWLVGWGLWLSVNWEHKRVSHTLYLATHMLSLGVGMLILALHLLALAGDLGSAQAWLAILACGVATALGSARTFWCVHHDRFVPQRRGRSSHAMVPTLAVFVTGAVVARLLIRHLDQRALLHTVTALVFVVAMVSFIATFQFLLRYYYMRLPGREYTADDEPSRTGSREAPRQPKE